MPTATRPRERSLRLGLSDKEADELFFYLHRVVDALWEAYEDVLMEGYWREEELRIHEERLAAERENGGACSDQDIPY